MKKLNSLLALTLLMGTIASPAVSLATENNLDADIKALYAEEQQAINLYEGIISKFGALRPYTNLLEAEKRHSSTIERIADRYSIDKNVEVELIEVPGTIEEARQLALKFEKMDIDDLNAIASKGYPADVTKSLENLAKASENHYNALAKTGENNQAKGNIRNTQSGRQKNR